MPFKTILEELVNNIPQAIGAIMVDWEGESVQEYCHCNPDEMRIVGAHQGIVLARLRETNADKSGGEIEDVVVTTQEQTLLIGVVDQDYSLVLQFERACPVELARYHFNHAIARLKKEL